MAARRKAETNEGDLESGLTPEGEWSPPPDIDWLEPRFAIGSRPYAPQRAAVARLGVDTVVALHTPEPGEAEGWAAEGVDFLPFPTRDWMEIPAERFTTVVEALIERLNAGHTVLLHCLAGVNRAPTIAAAVLCYRDGLAPDEAIEAVRGCRPAAAPTPEQVASLRAWLRRHQPRTQPKEA